MEAKEESGEETVAELKRQLHLMEDLLSDVVIVAGTLHKYIPRNEPLLLGRSWDRRYCIVKRASQPGELGQLIYWKSDKDVGTSPRGKIQLRDTYLVPEGEVYVGPSIWNPISTQYFWRFKIVDAQGSTIIRLSTDSDADYATWLSALQQAGAKLDLSASVDNTTHADTTAAECGDSPTASSAYSESDLGGSASHLRRLSPEVMSGPESTQRHPGVRKQLTTLVPRHPPSSSGYTSDTSEVTLRRVMTRPTARHVQTDRWSKRTGPPVHTHCLESALSWRRFKNESKRGFEILLLIWLFAANFRLVIENILKYGIRFDPVGFLRMLLVPRTFGDGPSTLYCWPVMALVSLQSLIIEKCASWVFLKEEKRRFGAQKKAGDGPPQDPRRHSRLFSGYLVLEVCVLFLHLANLIVLVSTIGYIVTRPDGDPLPAFVATLSMIALGMKLVSYQHVNWAHRQAHGRGELVPGERGSGIVVPGWKERDLPKYPENIHLKNLSYFLLAPTLCYQLAYPWEPLLRVRRIVKRSIALVLLISLMLFITEQYIEPTIDNSIKPLQEMDWLRMTERILKLAVPTLIYWLIMFYTLFHVWLNLLAEITHFGDREFYRQWWNATTLGDYWRLWNMPVHRWMVRHVYLPCQAVGMPKILAGIAVFFVSAVLHELAVGLPLRMLRAWSFMAIMAQVPLIHWTEYLKTKTKNNDIGNALFWLTFCFLGQPLALILYFHDFRKQMHG